MQEIKQLFFGLRLVRRIFEETLSRNPNLKYCNTLANFFIKKGAPANRKKGFYTNRVPKKQEVRGFLYLAAQNFELFSNI
jgi:hypothetical protein